MEGDELQQIYGELVDTPEKIQPSTPGEILRISDEEAALISGTLINDFSRKVVQVQHINFLNFNNSPLKNCFKAEIINKTRCTDVGPSFFFFHSIPNQMYSILKKNIVLLDNKQQGQLCSLVFLSLITKCSRGLDRHGHEEVGLPFFLYEHTEGYEGK